MMLCRCVCLPPIHMGLVGRPCLNHATRLACVILDCMQTALLSFPAHPYLLFVALFDANGLHCVQIPAERAAGLLAPKTTSTSVAFLTEAMRCACDDCNAVADHFTASLQLCWTCSCISGAAPLTISNQPARSIGPISDFNRWTAPTPITTPAPLIGNRSGRQSINFRFLASTNSTWISTSELRLCHYHSLGDIASLSTRRPEFPTNTGSNPS